MIASASAAPAAPGSVDHVVRGQGGSAHPGAAVEVVALRAKQITQWVPCSSNSATRRGASAVREPMFTP